MYTFLKGPQFYNSALFPILYLYAIKIIHCQNGTSLIFIADKSITHGFASLFIPCQIDVHYFSISKTGGERKKKKKEKIIGTEI